MKEKNEQQNYQEQETAADRSGIDLEGLLEAASSMVKNDVFTSALLNRKGAEAQHSGINQLLMNLIDSTDQNFNDLNEHIIKIGDQLKEINRKLEESSTKSKS